MVCSHINQHLIPSAMKKLIQKNLTIILICGFIFLNSPAFSQTVNITGTIKNSNGTVVSGATVSLINHPNIQATSGASGTFTLSSKITGIDDEDAKDKCNFENGTINIFPDNEPVRIDVYDLNGRWLKNIFNKKNQTGYSSYSIGRIGSEFNSILIVRIIIGNDIYNYKYFNNRGENFQIQPSFDNHNAVLKNTLAVVDTLVIKHNQYQTKKIALSSFSSSLGNIVLTSKNISYSFPGGTLQDLKNVSPTLNFATLDINGALKIPSAESSVTITAENININSSISTEYPTCSPYHNAPDLTLNVSGNVYINSTIYLYGKQGQGETTTSTCNSCTGTDGGTLTINAENITVSNPVKVYGGSGMYSYITSSTRCGCNAGDGGNIILNASNTLSISATGADLDVEGGDKGLGSTDCGNGVDGAQGYVDFEGATINVNEISGNMNMYDYNAQMLDYKKLTVYGSVSYQEEYDHRNNYGAWYVSFSGGVGITLYDWLEDLYVLRLGYASTVKLSLSASNSNADLDLYFLSGDMKTVIGQSNGATSTESITTAVMPAGKYFIAVSYSDDGKNYSTNYTLKLKQ